ncbi:MAG: hypothetical protein JNK21_03145 [Rhodospirillaceae bacterium]|nr:hypothetical protein [Rhodospirillaceae bacterium]
MRASLIALALTLFAAAGVLAQTPAPLIKGLGFISGCWTTPKGAAPEYRECYTAPYAGVIQGSSQTVKDQKTTAFEFALIAEKDGKITYAPFYNGTALSVFTLTLLQPGIAVFENPENDFPKKLIYQRNADGSLSARLEGNGRDDPQNTEYRMIPQGM